MLTLDQIQTFCGTPTEVDGIQLTEGQANFLARSISRLIGDAEHPFDRAVDLSLRAFRSSFELDEGHWRPVREISLRQGRGRALRHCFNQFE
jgi:hypothetical protein